MNVYANGDTYMRKIIYVLALCGSVSLLLAADPSAGKWKLNQDQSKLTTGAVPKEETIVIEDMGDTLHITIAGTADDGSPIAVSYVVPVAGGEGQLDSSAASSSYDGIAAKRTGENSRDTVYTKNGKKVGTSHAVTSKDGKTMTVDVSGADSQGKDCNGKMVFDKQQQ
jgi:hypothetical protein